MAVLAFEQASSEISVAEWDAALLGEATPATHAPPGQSSVTSATPDDELVIRHLSVARDVARRYRGRGVADEDLEQVACLGLVKAAKRYDPELGHHFLAFAVPTMRGEIRRHFRDLGWAIRPPRPIQEAQSQIRSAEADLCQISGRSPRPTEIAEHLGLDLETVIEALAADGCFTPTSLDATREDGDGGAGISPKLCDRLGEDDPGFATTEGLASLGPLLARLNEREKTMLRMRFYEGATQADIGKVLGISQMQVSRRLSSLLARLRDQLDEDVPRGAAGRRISARS